MRVGPIDPQTAALQRALLASSARETLPGFKASAIEAGPQAAPPTLTPPATSVQMLVAIAAASPKDCRRRAVAEVDRGLSALERLHAAQRLGVPAIEQIREIAAWARTRTVPEDAEAAQLLREIELRVLVELAKADRPD